MENIPKIQRTFLFMRSKLYIVIFRFMWEPKRYGNQQNIHHITLVMYSTYDKPTYIFAFTSLAIQMKMAGASYFRQFQINVPIQ